MIGPEILHGVSLDRTLGVGGRAGGVGTDPNKKQQRKCESPSIYFLYGVRPPASNISDDEPDVFVYFRPKGRMIPKRKSMSWIMMDRLESVVIDTDQCMGTVTDPFFIMTSIAWVLGPFYAITGGHLGFCFNC